MIVLVACRACLGPTITLVIELASLTGGSVSQIWRLVNPIFKIFTNNYRVRSSSSFSTFHIIMLSFSLGEVTRRGVWTCVSCSNLTWTCQALIASSSRPLSAKTHQRNHSSSKTSSSPKDAPRAIDTPSKTPIKKVNPIVKDDAEKRPNTRASRRKTRLVPAGPTEKNRQEPLLNVPTVPSTQHLHPQGKFRLDFF